MGIHIISIIVKGREDGYLDYDHFTDFDSIRMSGDSDFVFSEDFEWEYIYDNEKHPTHGDRYKRPKDLGSAKKWVTENVIQGNQKRLINLLKSMEGKNNLWIHVSY